MFVETGAELEQLINRHCLCFPKKSLRFWEDGTIEVYCLRENDLYEKTINSELIPDIDIELVVEHSRMADQYDAIKSFTEKIRKNKLDSFA